MLCKTAQVFDKEPFLQLEIFLENREKISRDFYEEEQAMASFKRFLYNIQEEFQKIGHFFQSISILAIRCER